MEMGESKGGPVGGSAGPAPGRLSPRGARRLAAATARVNKAKRLGPRATVEAVRACLLSAVKANPSAAFTDQIADYVLAKIGEMYADADRSGGKS